MLTQVFPTISDEIRTILVDFVAWVRFFNHGIGAGRIIFCYGTDIQRARQNYYRVSAYFGFNRSSRTISGDGRRIMYTGSAMDEQDTQGESLRWLCQISLTRCYFH